MRICFVLVTVFLCLLLTGCSDFGDPPAIPEPSLTVVGDTVTEGEVGACSVELSFVPQLPVTFVVTAISGSATAGSDFALFADTMTIDPAAGEGHAHIAIPTTQDNLIESPELFQVRVTAVTNATVANDSAVCVILDDDGLPVLTLAGGTATEGQLCTFTVALNKVGVDPVIFTYATSDSTATAGADYTAVSGTDTIPAGQTSTDISVQTIDDITAEVAETFILTIAGVTQATALNSSVAGTILDNEPVAVSFSKDVQPILSNRCIGCHAGPGAEKGFRIDSYNNVINSGENAPQVIPFNAAGSRLYNVIIWKTGYPAMPQTGQKLPATDIQKIKDWIDQGALDN